MKHLQINYEFWSFALMLLAAGIAYVGLNLPPSDAYLLLTPSPEVFEFGTVKRGELEGQFKLTNLSDGRLNILYGIPTCACQKFEVPRKIIDPGQSVQCKFLWDAWGELGRTQRHFAVVYKLDDEAQTRLTKCIFQGDVIADFSFRPRQLRFSLAKKQIQNAKVTFISSATGFAVTGADCVHPAFSVTCNKATNELTVFFDPDKWTSDDIEIGHQVSITTNRERGGDCVIPVFFGSGG